MVAERLARATWHLLPGDLSRWDNSEAMMLQVSARHLARAWLITVNGRHSCPRHDDLLPESICGTVGTLHRKHCSYQNGNLLGKTSCRGDISRLKRQETVLSSCQIKDILLRHKTPRFLHCSVTAYQTQLEFTALRVL